MSTMQRLTLIGLYNYDNSLFDEMTLPTGYVKQTLIDALLLEHGEKCVLYPDFDFLKFSIGAVSRKWALELEKIYDALTAEYSPIENYDRTEDISDTYTRGTTTTTNAEYNHDRTANLSNTVERLEAETNEHKVSAYNSNIYEPNDQTTTTGGKVKESDTGTDKVYVHGKIAEVTNVGQDSNSHDAHIHGNIGVTTNQQMITAEIEMRVQKNLYDMAARIFANELLIQIY